MTTHRVKRQDMIMALFVLFSSEYDKQSYESIFEIVIPISKVQAHIEKRFKVSYSGSNWITTQIRNYEEEIGHHLFEKTSMNTNEFGLKLYHDMVSFTQKKHLYITQKINVSNAIYDLIVHNTAKQSKTNFQKPLITLLIDAGSSVSHLADIIADHTTDSSIQYEIYTHNISVIQRFLYPHVNQNKICVQTPKGTVDPISNSILGENHVLYNGVSFDMIIQGVSFLYDGSVWVENPVECDVKRRILKEAKGPKVLILTGHEVRFEAPKQAVFPFGRFTDFDILVIPYNSEGRIKNLNKMLIENKGIVKPEILNWNYQIYRIESESDS